MKYNITAKNRFSGKIYEYHFNATKNIINQVQDRYFWQPWVTFDIAENLDIEIKSGLICMVCHKHIDDPIDDVDVYGYPRKCEECKKESKK